MRGIIDAHSHYMPQEVAEKTMFFKVNWSDVDAHLSAMDKSGIEKALLVYPTSDAHIQMGSWSNLCSVYNREISRVVKAHPGRFVGEGILPIDKPEALPDELRRIEDLGLKVICLASSYEGRYLDDPLFDPVFSFAQTKGMPVHVHPQIINPIGEERIRDPLLTPALSYVFDVSMCIGKMMMEGTFVKYPEVDFIFAHYGGILPFIRERFDNTYTMLRKRNFVKDIGRIPSEYFKNLYFDMSGSKSQAALLCALELTDVSHVLFGSDWPANQKLLETIEMVDIIKLTDEDKDLLFRNPLLAKL